MKNHLSGHHKIPDAALKSQAEFRSTSKLGFSDSLPLNLEHLQRWYQQTFFIHRLLLFEFLLSDDIAGPASLARN